PAAASNRQTLQAAGARPLLGQQEFTNCVRRWVATSRVHKARRPRICSMSAIAQRRAFFTATSRFVLWRESVRSQNLKSSGRRFRRELICEVKTSTGLRPTQETFFFPAALLLSPEGSSYVHGRIVWIAASSPRGTIEESVARADMLMFGPC